MSEVVPVKAKPWGYRRFSPGPEMRDIHEVVHAINVGCWLYYAGTPKHPAVLKNMSLATLMGSARSGRIRIAKENHLP